MTSACLAAIAASRAASDRRRAAACAPAFSTANSGCARAQFHTVFSVGIEGSARQIDRKLSPAASRTQIAAATYGSYFGA